MDMDRSVKVPAIPALPANADQRLAPAVAALKEIVETREGRRGGPMDRAVTVRDLVAWGLISEDDAS